MERDTNKLPEDFKAKWIQAMKSGEYKKGSGRLLTIVNDVCFYCCFGVYAHLKGWEFDIQAHPRPNRKEALNLVQDLPVDKGYYPSIEKDGVDYHTIIEMVTINDSSQDFDRVIQYIEENL